MPEWNDVGIILSAKKYGEKGLIVNILTKSYGRHIGWVHNYKTKNTLTKLPGCTLDKILFVL